MQETMQQQAQFKVAAIDAPLEERLAFLKKVYGLLATSVFTAAAAAYMTLTTEAFFNMVARSQILFLVLFIGTFFFAQWARKKEGMATIALFSFTIISGIMISPVIYAFQHVVVEALLLTGITFAALSFYAVTTKKDLSFLGGMLMTALIVMIVGGLLNMFFFQSSAISFAYSAIGVLVFSGFILYDTQNILRRYPTDEYISATLSLYLDVLNLFLMILRLLGGSRD